jgi:hypothetical protein
MVVRTTAVELEPTQNSLDAALRVTRVVGLMPAVSAPLAFY